MLAAAALERAKEKAEEFTHKSDSKTEEDK